MILLWQLALFSRGLRSKFICGVMRDSIPFLDSGLTWNKDSSRSAVSSYGRRLRTECLPSYGLWGVGLDPCLGRLLYLLPLSGIVLGVLVWGPLPIRSIAFTGVSTGEGSMRIISLGGDWGFFDSGDSSGEDSYIGALSSGVPSNFILLLPGVSFFSQLDFFRSDLKNKHLRWEINYLKTSWKIGWYKHEY